MNTKSLLHTGITKTIHTNTQTHKHTHTHTHIHARVRAHTNTHRHTHIHKRTDTQTNARTHAQAQKHTAIATLVYTNSRIHNNTTDSDGLKYTHINTGKQRSKQKTHTFNEEHCNTTRITRMPWKENTDLIKVSNYDLIKV